MDEIIVLSVIFGSLFLVGKFLVFIGGLGERKTLTKAMDEIVVEENISEKNRILFENGNGIIFGHDGEIRYCIDNSVNDSITHLDISRQYVDYDIVLGEDMVSRKNILDTAGKAVVGGVMLGGIGAIAGAFLGSSRHEGRYNKVELRLNISINGRFAVIRNVLMDTGTALVREDSALYQDAIQKLDYIIEEIENSNRGFED